MSEDFIKTKKKIIIDSVAEVRAKDLEDGSFFVASDGELYMVTDRAYSIPHMKVVCLSKDRPSECYAEDDEIVKPVDVEIKCTPARRG